MREFAEREILPHVEEHEREERYPLELIQKLVPLGFIAPMIPEEYGGSFSDVVTYGVICEELARVDWVVASVVSVTNSLVGGSILRHGSDAQKQRWLPPMARGEVLTSACLTEPGGGTDLANMRTTAEKVDGGYRLERHQGLHLARGPRGALLRRGDRRPRAEAQGRHGLPGRSAERGHAIGEFPMRTLKRDNLAEVHFEDVFVPDDGLLGRPGGGFPVLGGALDMGRYSVAARCVGQSQRCIDLASRTRGSARPSARRSASSR